MAFNPVNFLNAPRGQHPLEGLAEALAQGFKIGHLPFDMANEQKREQLQNAMNAFKLQNEPNQNKRNRRRPP